MLRACQITTPLPPDITIGDAPLAVTLKDGSSLARTITASPGSKDDLLTLPQLKTKWMDCLEHGSPYLNEEAAGLCCDRGLDLCGASQFGDKSSQLLMFAARS